MEPIIFSLLCGIATIIGGILVIYKHDWSHSNQNYLVAFASGTLVSLSFIEIIPESLKMGNQGGLSVIIGFLLLYLFEQVFAPSRCIDDECKVNRVSLLAWGGLLLHSFIDGIAIVASFKVSQTLGLIVALGVLLHEFPEGLTSGALLILLGYSRKKIFFLIFLVAVATPVGAILSFFSIGFFNPDSIIPFLSSFLGLAAGTFIYVGVADLLPHSHRIKDLKVTLIFLSGVLLIIIGHFLKGD